MPTGAKKLARALLPEPLLSIVRAIRARRHSQRLNVVWQVRPIDEQVFQRLGPRVLGGPFEGLALPARAVREHISPYLLGTYEHELHPVWRALAKARVALVVNVGSKFGYYAVGLARLLGCPAVAFDPDPWAKRATRETARLNAVPDVRVRTLCSRAWLETLAPGALVMIDCDGCEVALLGRPVPSGLRRATLIVEVHERVICGSGARLRDELAETHDVEVIPSQPAAAAPGIDVSFLTPHEQELALAELRPPQSWIVARPRP